MSEESQGNFRKEIMNIFKDVPYSNQIKDNRLRIVLDLIEERFRDIEKITNKKRKKPFVANRPQKFLLLYHLKMLGPLITNQDLTTDQKARLLSIILDEDYDNLHGNISGYDRTDTPLNIEGNYKFLLDVFKHYQVDKLANEMDEHLHSIISAKEEIKKS